VLPYLLTRLTHRLHRLPVLVLMPHSRCNCRCVMCDIWKANANGMELTAADLAPHILSLKDLGVRQVAFSGGEALMHSNLWALCAAIREQLGARITLLSTGLLLRRHAVEILRWCDEVIVSIDGSREVHDAIRNIPRAFDKLAEGVAALKDVAPAFPIAGRCVVQRRNYMDLPVTVAAARQMGLDGISFLAADVSSEAFNRPGGWDGKRVSDVALTREEVDALRTVIEGMIAEPDAGVADGFVEGGADKLRALPRYYAALNGDAGFPAKRCNAPWVSAVVEADGLVRPCFFHEPIGDLSEAPLAEILNGPRAVAFRRNLRMDRDETCRRCVASLYRSPLRGE
jgi:Fe-coproporphyrin III synthase